MYSVSGNGVHPARVAPLQGLLHAGRKGRNDHGLKAALVRRELLDFHQRGVVGRRCSRGARGVKTRITRRLSSDVFILPGATLLARDSGEQPTRGIKRATPLFQLIRKSLVRAVIQQITTLVRQVIQIGPLSYRPATIPHGDFKNLTGNYPVAVLQDVFQKKQSLNLYLCSIYQ
jgi:hypothetical protein